MIMTMKKILTLFLFLPVGTNSVAYAGNASSPDAVDFARTVAQLISVSLEKASKKLNKTLDFFSGLY